MIRRGNTSGADTIVDECGTRFPLNGLQTKKGPQKD